MCGASTFFSTCVRFKVIAPLADVNALLLLTVPIPQCRTHKTLACCVPWQEVEYRCARLLAERISDREGRQATLFPVAHTIQNVLKIDHELIEPQFRQQFQEAQARLSVRLLFQKDSRPLMFVVPNGKFRRSMLQGLSSGLCNPHRTYY